MSHDLKLSENGLKINFLLNVWMCGILDMDMHVVNSVLSQSRFNQSLSNSTRTQPTWL